MDKKYRAFLEMNESKRDDIIRAVLKEYAQYPYDVASINRILANAHFSKGGIYHYFSGKKDLFIGVTQYIIEYYSTEMDHLLKTEYGDVLERLKECGYIQSVIGRRYPYYSEFLFRLENGKLGKEIPEIVELLEWFRAEETHRLYENFDEKLLKEEITRDEAIKVIACCMAGITEMEYLEGMEVMSLDERHNNYACKVFGLIDILRKMLYK